MTVARSIPSGRARLAAEAAGSGLPAICLHAGVADRRMWRGQLPALAAHFLAVAYDRRGFGETGPVDEAWSQVGDLAAVLDAVGGPGTPAVLIGCSQGGRIAIDFTLAFPARVRALVLVAPAISGAPDAGPDPEPFRPVVQELGRAEREGDVDRVNALEAHAWLDGPLSPAGRVGGHVRELFLAMNGIALRAPALGQQQEPPSAYERLGEIGVPALVVWGDLDFPGMQQIWRNVAATLPDARSHVLHGVAHLPNLERPADFNRLLLDFCRRFAGPPGR
jgi:pimeloyl-ACP methyl ester carboxylesterase